VAPIYGSIVLSDNSRVTQNQIGISGFGYDVESTGTEVLPGFVIVDSTTLKTDSTFFQREILGPGNLPFCLSDWTYFGGHQRPDTTWVDGTWMTRWYDPRWLWYSVWYENYLYDTSGHETGLGPFSLIGYKYRSPTRKNVGNYYASMVVPDMAGHYQARWVYEKDNSSYAHEVIVPFVGLSAGIDAMPDYPLPQPPADSTAPNNDFEGNDSLGQTYIPATSISDESPDLSEGGGYG
jgi:hypothetical protein